MSDQRLTDLSYLEEMGMGDASLVIEMVELFLENTPESLRQLKKYNSEEKWTLLAAEAHKLKPNLSYMGLEGAKKTIIEIEEIAKNQTELDSIEEKIHEVEEICKQAYTELQDRLANLKN